MTNTKHIRLPYIYGVLGFIKHSVADNQGCYMILGDPGQRRIWDLFITLNSSLNLKYGLFP